MVFKNNNKKWCWKGKNKTAIPSQWNDYLNKTSTECVIMEINKGAKIGIWIQSDCIKQWLSFIAAKINSKIHSNIKIPFIVAT